MRTPTITGNWKMHLDRDEAVELARQIRNHTRPNVDGVVAVTPAYPFIYPVAKTLEGSAVGLGAQDVDPEPKGARTGAVSAAMLKSVGCTFTLVGHSERRHVFGDTDELVASKLRAALAAGLEVTLCIGEKLEQREAGRTDEVVLGQLDAGIQGLSDEDLARVILAYEPVWAIGTGRTASPEQAQEVHATIRAHLAETRGQAVAERTIIQYGGSVKPGNAAELLGQPDVDGLLIGGASLDAESFVAIVRAGR